MERSLASICCVEPQQRFLRHRFILVCVHGSRRGAGRLEATLGSRSTSGHLRVPIIASVFGWQMMGGGCCSFSLPCREGPQSLLLSDLHEWLSNVCSYRFDAFSYKWVFRLKPHICKIETCERYKKDIQSPGSFFTRAKKQNHQNWFCKIIRIKRSSILANQ